ncbi:P-loop containing nucleoside triphosphate hydrolase protein [Halteromyces radiatus]|uniref:P-loop containing nucleoside triphosphate hydrolase protein n=1 Tax=Halteromyces radiatus TaxID=101107 RepID=UPI0022203F4F|nr:P-loop containing nucleoside triphosphate hydrolase protein [Halteromyces radiatus]KAI8098787.1 P-loop containing nucleoside triphosphate hydrolase protein [Halteromyces radiatus]
MPLEVIGAGFGRTGTMSLHHALDKLGYRTHHMVRLMSDPNQDPSVWSRAYDDPEHHEDEWESVYGKYTAAVDWPTATFYKELSEKYPDAKVILTVRSAESWYKSMHNTVFKHVSSNRESVSKHNDAVVAMVRHTILGGILEKDVDKIHDEKYICQLFNDHVEQVKRTIPADRLLVLNLGDGWEPLCRFLGKDIPDEPYPSTNTGDDFNRLVEEFKQRYA